MENEMTVTEMKKLPHQSYVIIDIRDEYSFGYGHIDGAVNIPQNKINDSLSAIPKNKKLIICCKSGLISRNTADELCDQGFEAYNLTGGYCEWLRGKLENAEITETVEQSIRKKFSRTIWSKFTKAITAYDMITPGDKIAVCISGGKDSMLMAKLFQELKRHDKFPFELVFLVMDPGYSPENRSIIEKNAEAMSIPLTIFGSDIFEAVYNVEKSPWATPHNIAQKKSHYKLKKEPQSLP